LLKKSVAQMAKLLVVQTDVTRLESVKNAVEQVRSELGQITALAYNASGYGRGGFLELDPKTIQQSFEVGAVHLSQRVIPDMLSAGHGFISLTGATAALRGRVILKSFALAGFSSRLILPVHSRKFQNPAVFDTRMLLSSLHLVRARALIYFRHGGKSCSEKAFIKKKKRCYEKSFALSIKKSITVRVKAKERVLACILQRAATMQLFRSISTILELPCEI
jgi:hypothetical protein